MKIDDHKIDRGCFREHLGDTRDIPEGSLMSSDVPVKCHDNLKIRILNVKIMKNDDREIDTGCFREHGAKHSSSRSPWGAKLAQGGVLLLTVPDPLWTLISLVQDHQMYHQSGNPNIV